MSAQRPLFSFGFAQPPIQPNLVPGPAPPRDVSMALPLAAGLNALRRGGALADVRMLVDGEAFPVHRAVLAACSPAFLAMFSSNFQEGQRQNGAALVEVAIADASKEAFALFLDLLYGSKGDPSDDWRGLEVDILELADRYLVDHVKAECERRLLNLDAVSALRVLRQADKPVITSKIREDAVRAVLRGWASIAGSPEWADFQAAFPVMADTLRAARSLLPQCSSPVFALPMPQSQRHLRDGIEWWSN